MGTHNYMISFHYNRTYYSSNSSNSNSVGVHTSTQVIVASFHAESWSHLVVAGPQKFVSPCYRFLQFFCESVMYQHAFCLGN